MKVFLCSLNNRTRREREGDEKRFFMSFVDVHFLSSNHREKQVFSDHRVKPFRNQNYREGEGRTNANAEMSNIKVIC